MKKVLPDYSKKALNRLSKMLNRKNKGLFFEQLALDWLKENGLTLVQQNFHCRFGEIDLIMSEQNTLCFVEVKFRKDNAFGGTAYSIPYTKQQKITKAALTFISQHKKYQQHDFRFDALFIQPDQQQQNKIEWIQNAFCID